MPYTCEGELFLDQEMSGASVRGDVPRAPAHPDGVHEYVPSGIRRLRIRALEEAWALHAAHANGVGGS